MIKHRLKGLALTALLGIGTTSVFATQDNVTITFLNCGYVKENSRSTYGYENGDEIKAWKNDCSDSRAFGFQETMDVTITSNGIKEHNMIGAKHWGCDKSDDKAAKDASKKSWVPALSYILAFRDQIKYRLYAVEVSNNQTLSCDLLTKTPPHYQEIK